MSVSDPTVFPAGVIQLLQWTMMADGTTYMQAWASQWKVITNSASGIDGLRTTDKYHVVCYHTDGRLLAVFPGCQVKAFVACDQNPSYKGGPPVFTLDRGGTSESEVATKGDEHG